MFDLSAITTVVKHNPLLLTGFSFLAGGGVMATLKSIPSAIAQGIRRQALVRVEITDESRMFGFFKDWLSDHEYSKKTRLLSAGLTYVSGEHEVSLTPAPGFHTFWYKGRLLWMTRTKAESKGNSGGKYTEGFTISTFGRNQKFIRDFLEEVVQTYNNKYSDYTSLYVNCPDQWRHVHRIPERKVDSIILEENVLTGVIEDLQMFKDNKEWYQALGIPYHRGYLFYGVPGAGKSSLVGVLAYKHKMDVYVLNLADPKLNDSTLYNLILSMPTGSALLLEDVDALFRKRVESETKMKNNVTFSGLLNILDGVFAKEGTVVFMTTNHIETLDPALIRPGRIDRQLFFDYANGEQIRKMFLRFYPGAEEDAKFFVSLLRRPLAMADLQTHFLGHHKDPQGAISDVARLNAPPPKPPEPVPVVAEPEAETVEEEDTNVTA